MEPLRVFRATLREAGYLPHPYLQAFVKGRTGDFFRRYRNDPEPSKSLSRARANLRKLERINRGEQKPFMQLLRHAYGRTGKLRHELLQPHLASSDPNFPSRERIIPSEKNSVPPAYTPTLVSLLTSPRAIKTSKPLSRSDLLSPRALPERAANASSEEARLLGPFSLRRLVNIHRRQFNEQTSRTLPPLEVRAFPDTEILREGSLQVPSTGLEKFDPVQRLAKLGTANSLPTPSRMRNNGEKLVVTVKSSESTAPAGKVGTRSRRWLRRRYRELLAEIPSLTMGSHPRGLEREYKVDWASPELALAHEVPRPLRLITTEEEEWIARARSTEAPSRTGRTARKPSNTLE